MQYKRRHLQGNSRQVPLSAIKDEGGCRGGGSADAPEGEASPSAAVTDWESGRSEAGINSEGGAAGDEIN
jgi:hypothetical protein